MFKAIDYLDAMNQLQAFMDSEEFFADVDCRIEVFDGDMKPVTDYEVIDEMLIEAYERQNNDAWDGVEAAMSASAPREDIFIKEEEVKVEKKPEAPPADSASKEVKFSDIKIEDGR